MTPPRILVVDDEPHIVQVLSLTLGRAGYDVQTVSDGDAAWEAIQQHRPDLVITDQAMPGLTGTQLAERVEQLPGDKPLPVLIITARQLQPGPDEPQSVCAILPKPFSPRQVLAHAHDLAGPPTRATQETHS